MILLETCPMCGSDPVIASPMLTPWFCSNDECECLAWDPYSSLADNLMDARPALIEERRPPAHGTDQT